MNKSLKTFLSYVIPSMVAMLIVGSYSIVDTIFIGQATGETGLAAVAITWPIMLLFGAFGDMLGTGAAVLISQERGKKDFQKAKFLFGNMLLMQLVLSLILLAIFIPNTKSLLFLFGATPELIPMAMDYVMVLVWANLLFMLGVGLGAIVRNDGRPILAMFLMILGLGLNIILDYIFIFVLDGGVKGAALATVVSLAVGILVTLGYFLTPWTHVRITKGMFKIKPEYMKQIAVTGIPSLGNQLSIIAMLFLHNFQSMRYGGVSGLAAYTFIGAIESMGSLLLTGLALGIQPLVAFFNGAKNYVQQRIMGNMGYATALGLGVILMVVSLLGCDIFPTWFNLTGETAVLAAHGLVLSSTAFLLLGVVRVAGYYYQSTGKIIYSSILIYGDAFAALPLCLFILPIFCGLDGVWLSMPVSRLLLFLLALYFWYGKRK